MRVRAAWVLATASVLGCSGDGKLAADAGNDAIGTIMADAGACGPLPPVPACTATCGNDQLEPCYDIYTRNGVCEYRTRTEQCDGTTTPTCAELGYFDDARPCTENCYIVDTSCEPCAPGDIACVTLGSFRVDAVAVSGGLVGMLEPVGPAGPPSKIWVIDHLTRVADASPEMRASGIVGVADGWLVATTGPSALYPFDAAGNFGTPHPIDTDEPALAYGPGQRVIVTWSEYVQAAWQVHFEIADTSGQLVVPKTVLFGGGQPSVDSDGAAFFVGASGSLARIASDGTRTITTGFPAGTTRRVTWHGTTGWYVANHETLPTSVARRFDATGAPQGSAITVGVFEDVLADGNDLLLLRYVGRQLHLLRIDPSGATVASTVVGAGITTARIVRAAGALYVAWSWPSKLRVAQVTI